MYNIFYSILGNLLYDILYYIYSLYTVYKIYTNTCAKIKKAKAVKEGSMGAKKGPGQLFVSAVCFLRKLSCLLRLRQESFMPGKSISTPPGVRVVGTTSTLMASSWAAEIAKQLAPGWDQVCAS